MIQIRDLKARDFHTLAGIIGKMPKDSLAVLGEITSKDGTARPAEEVGVAVIKAVFETAFVNAADEVESWFADLAGVPVEQYREMPISTPVEILEGVLSKKDFIPFLYRSAKLAMAGLLTLKSTTGMMPSKKGTGGQIEKSETSQSGDSSPSST